MITHSQMKILLIEDNPGDARLIQECIQDSELEVNLSRVSTLEEGLQTIQSGEYDSLLLDLGLPDSQGLGSLEKIRHINEKLPIIILTGAAEDTLGISSIQAGAQDYLAKDEITPKVLARTVNYAIERTKLEYENLRLYEKSIRQLHQLKALREIDLAIAHSLDLDFILDVVIKYGVSLLEVDAMSILLIEPSKKLKFIKSRGLKSKELEHVEIQYGSGISGKVVTSGKPLHIPDLSKYGEFVNFTNILMKQGFSSMSSYPLTAKNEVVGVIELYNRSNIRPRDEWWALLESLSGQSAIAIHNANLFARQQQAQEELIRAYDATIEGWAQAIEIRDKETQGHTLRTVELTLDLVKGFGFSSEEITHIKRGAILHDIGKLIIPDDILHKPDALTDEEWVVMRKHPEIAKSLLEKIDYLRPAIDIPYNHHEKWDGSGYPRGLKGEEIPLPARIFAIVDVWDALNSDRPYRKAWSFEDCLAYIKEQSGIHFDPAVVEAFLKIVESQ